MKRPPIVGLPVLVSVFLIAEAANRKTVVAVVVVPVHVGVVVVQVAVPRVVRSVLRRGPEVGVVACVVEPVVPVAGGNDTKARSLFISSRSNVAFASLADGSAF